MKETFNRLNNSVQFLEKNQPFRVEDVWLIPINSEVLAVQKASSYKYKQNITRTIAQRELYELKLIFAEMMINASLFADFAKHRTIEYFIYIDFGTLGAEYVCKEKNGSIEFYI